jgi:hypothetical protein
MTIPAIIYAARSASERDEGAKSTDSQLAVVREILARDGREPYVRPFKEDGHSGSRKNRGPELQAAIDAAVAAAVEHGSAELWAFHSSRFARGSGRLGEARALGKLFYDLRAQGVALRTVEDDEFVRNEQLIGIASSQASKYAEDLGAHVRRGYLEKAREGRPMFGIVPDGYRVVYDHDDAGRIVGRRMLKDPERKVIYELTWSLAVQGRSDRAIILELDRRGYRTSPRKRGHEPRPFDANRVRQTLANPTYAGQQVHRGKVVGAGAWEAYVSPEDFERVQAMRRQRAHVSQRKGGRPPIGYLLGDGLGRCVCGAKLDCVTDRHERKDGSRARRYVCRTHRERPQDCSVKPFDAALIDPAIVDNLDRMLGDVDDMRSEIAGARRLQREKLQREAERAREDMVKSDRIAAAAKRKLDEALAAGHEERADAYADALAERKAERKRAEDRLNAALDAAVEPDGEVDESSFYGALRAELAGRMDGAREDVRRLNEALRDFLAFVELTPMDDGKTLVRPVLSDEAALRILRDTERWDGVRISVPDMEATGRVPQVGEPITAHVEIPAPEAFTTQTHRSPW